MAIFILFSQQRSGTGALASFISGHPQIRNLSEILNPNDVGQGQEDNFFSFWIRKDPLASMQACISPSHLFSNYIDEIENKYLNQHILLDIKLNSIRHVLNYWEEFHGFSETGMPWLINFFQRRAYPVIYLHRENHFHRFVSSRLAEATGVYRTNDRRHIGPGKVELDLGQMTDFIVKSEASHDYFKPMLDKFDRHLYLTYEQTFSGSAIRPEVKFEIARFFGIPLLVDHEPYYVKLRSASMERVVANLAEVTAELERIGREHYLLS